MTNLGAFFLAVAICFLGIAIDNGLTNISRAIIYAKGEKKE